MTRMGFGLNAVPKIMTKVLSRVLPLDSRIALGTDHYIDNVIVNLDVVSVKQVKDHLALYRLVTKETINNRKALIMQEFLN